MVVARGFRIRRAGESDVAGILECLHAAFEEYRTPYTPYAYLATVLTERMARRRLRTMTVWVAVGRGHRVLGTLAVKRSSGRHTHLRGMAVRPELQGRGIASALLAAAIRGAQRDGQRYVTLETTEPLHRATAFYLRHGFLPTGRYRHWGGMKLIGFQRTLFRVRRPKPRRRARAGERRGVNRRAASEGRTRSRAPT